MGNVLDAPITAKENEAGSGLGLSFGVCSMQGWRRTMEDSHVAQIGLPYHTGTSFFGVFDGHGGSTVSNTTAEKIVQTLAATPQYQDASDPTSWSRVIYSAMFRLDRALRQMMFHYTERSGSTAIMALITPTHILVPNIGDSRSVLARNNTVVAMSEDHKPTKPGERRRIKKAGSTVSMQRVNGELAVSRALGDFSFKTRKDLPPDAQAVSCAPEIRVVPRHPTDEFLLLCCDGIWDVMTNEEAVAFVRRERMRNPDLCTVMNNLVTACLNKGSRDNMTAMIVVFDSPVDGLQPDSSAAMTPRSARGTQSGSKLPRVGSGNKRVLAFGSPGAGTIASPQPSTSGPGSAFNSPRTTTKGSTQGSQSAAPTVGGGTGRLFHSSPSPLTVSEPSALMNPLQFTPTSGQLRQLGSKSPRKGAASASPSAGAMPLLRRNTRGQSRGGQRHISSRGGARPGSVSYSSGGRRLASRGAGGKRRGKKASPKVSRGSRGTSTAQSRLAGLQVTGGASPFDNGQLTPAQLRATLQLDSRQVGKSGFLPAATSGNGSGPSSATNTGLSFGFGTTAGRPSRQTNFNSTGQAVEVSVSTIGGNNNNVTAGYGGVYASADEAMYGSRLTAAQVSGSSPAALNKARALYAVNNGPRSIRSRQRSRQGGRRNRPPTHPVQSGWSANNAPSAQARRASDRVRSAGRRPKKLKHLQPQKALSEQGRSLLAATLTPAELKSMR